MLMILMMICGQGLMPVQETIGIRGDHIELIS